MHNRDERVKVSSNASRRQEKGYRSTVMQMWHVRRTGVISLQKVHFRCAKKLELVDSKTLFSGHHLVREDVK